MKKIYHFTTRRTILPMFMVLLTNIGLAQTELPILKATSTSVNVLDGETLRKNAWTIMPDIKPDIYYTSSKKVVFYTDKGHLEFKISPKIREYNFIVLLNDKDTAYTQIKYERPQKPYLKTLKGAKKYNYSDKRYVPKFKYEDKDNESLKALRNKYNLDSIAGSGSELSKILNLMYWVNRNIRHDGTSNNPIKKNGVDLIEICKKENRGVNCRMLATILNECYLSMGIKSKFITCMPKDSTDQDCHVINSVYSSELKKWIWIDPSFRAYVMNDKGELQSIEEVRRKLIKGEHLILNPEACWNNTITQTKEYYLNQYMAKNLYRFSASVFSTHDTETLGRLTERSYIELISLDEIKQTPQAVIEYYTDKDNNITYTFENYKTNNPDVFWILPNL